MMRTKVMLRRRRRRKGIYIASILIFGLALLLFMVRPVGDTPKIQPLPDAEVNLGTAKQERDPAESQTPAPQYTEKIEVPELNFFIIQFGAYDQEENARVEAARYVKRGAAGYVLKDGDVSRVFGAAYVSRESAERVAGQLKTEEQIDCYIYTGHAEAVTLKVTATQAQIDAITECIRLLRDETEILGALGFEIDKGEMSVQDACKSLQAAFVRVNKAYTAYKSSIGENTGMVVTGLSKMLDTLSQTLETLANEKDLTEMSMSSKIKYATIDLWLSQGNYVWQITQAT